MKTQIKLTALVLALVMLMGMCFSVSAEAPIKLEVKIDGEVTPGADVTAMVYLTGANIKALTLTPACNNDVFEIVEAKWTGDFIEDVELKDNWNGTDGAAMALNEARDFADEAVLKIVLKVKETAVTGAEFNVECTDIAIALFENGVENTYNVSENSNVVSFVPFVGEIACAHNYEVKKNTSEHWLECSECGDTKGNAAHTWDNGVESQGEILYTCTFEGCGQTKTEAVSSTVLYGDVNGDGSVNAKDRTYLARYLTSWTGYDESVINLANADVNADGVVNAKDRTVLARHLTSWTGYENLPYGK